MLVLYINVRPVAEPGKGFLLLTPPARKDGTRYISAVYKTFSSKQQ